MFDLAVSVLEGDQPPWQLACVELSGFLGTSLTGTFEVQWPSGLMKSSLLDDGKWTGELPWTPGDIVAHPLVRHVALHGDLTPRTTDEVVDECGWYSSPAYAAARDAFDGAFAQVLVPLRTGSGIVRYLGAARPGRTFNDRERAYVQRVQPLLLGMDRQEQELRRLRSPAGPTSPEGGGGPGLDVTPDHERRAAEAGITPRQLVVLALVAEGLTAVAAARRLGISPRTFTKHQEKLYRALGAPDRLTAVLTAQRLGILPEPAHSELRQISSR